MPSDQKLRGKRPKKRKFHGNQHSKASVCKKTKAADYDENTTDTARGEKDNVVPSSSGDATPTRSARKVSQGREAYFDLENEQRENDGGDEFNLGCDITDIDQTGSRIFDMDILNMNISSSVVCRYCKQSVRLLEVKRKGLGSHFAFHCESETCDRQTSFPNCAVSQVKNLENYSINRRALLAMRCIGNDRAELRTFCGVMDLPPPVQDSTYSMINKTVQAAAVTVQEDSMRRAAEEEYTQAEPIPDEVLRNIDVSSDGTWMTPGHSSKIGQSFFFFF